MQFLMPRPHGLQALLANQRKGFSHCIPACRIQLSALLYYICMAGMSCPASLALEPMQYVHRNYLIHNTAMAYLSFI